MGIRAWRPRSPSRCEQRPGLWRQKTLHGNGRHRELPQMGCSPLAEKSSVDSESAGVSQSPDRDERCCAARQSEIGRAPPFFARRLPRQGCHLVVCWHLSSLTAAFLPKPPEPGPPLFSTRPWGGGAGGISRGHTGCITVRTQPTAPKNNFLLPESGEDKNSVRVRRVRRIVICDCAVVGFS